jgi:sugar O-acyltransferase (sialic acid O-acetyltransferase NeuD family)
MSNPQIPLRELLILGAGGSGREVAWLARDVHGTGISLTFAVEPHYATADRVDGIPVVAFDDTFSPSAAYYVIAVGNIVERRRLAAACDARGLMPATLVHPGVTHSSRVEFGVGSIVCAGSIMTTNVRVGSHVHVNVGCTLSHDVVLGDFATLSPGVHVSGHVHVEDGVFLGTGANIINGIAGRPLIIGRGAIVAAGACVTGPVEAGALVAGVPAIRKR